MNIPKKGDESINVKALQNRLLLLGYELPIYDADGKFGDETESAVKAWQHDHHVDGTLDENEWQALFPPPSPREWPSPLHGQTEVIERYGKPWQDVQGWWKKWGAPAQLPPELKRLTKRGKIWCNKDIAPVLEAVFEEIADQALAHFIKTFDGCFSVRKQRGNGMIWSVHTWALAIDLNAAENPLSAKSRMHPGIVEIFKTHGFVWGGDFKRKDAMHYQYVTGF
jgi:hypothetical protein